MEKGKICTDTACHITLAPTFVYVVGKTHLLSPLSYQHLAVEEICATTSYRRWLLIDLRMLVCVEKLVGGAAEQLTIADISR